MAHPILLALSGSLRQQAYSTAVLHGLRDAAAGQAEIRLHPLNGVPLYNQDLDTPSPPDEVAALRQAVADADELIISTPEYNHGIPGVLKNALDWASRPYGRSTMTGKAVLAISSSPGAVGGARAHAQLNETLASIAARIVLRPQAVIANVHQKLADGRLTDRETLDFLLAGVGDLLRDAARPGSADREAS